MGITEDEQVADTLRRRKDPNFLDNYCLDLSGSPFVDRFNNSSVICSNEQNVIVMIDMSIYSNVDQARLRIESSIARQIDFDSVITQIHCLNIKRKKITINETKTMQHTINRTQNVIGRSVNTLEHYYTLKLT